MALSNNTISNSKNEKVKNVQSLLKSWEEEHSWNTIKYSEGVLM